MPYALFCDEAKLSKAYPTEADVWRLARESGLVVDITTNARRSAVHLCLDNNYEIRACAAEPGRGRRFQPAWRQRAENHGCQDVWWFKMFQEPCGRSVTGGGAHP